MKIYLLCILLLYTAVSCSKANNSTAEKTSQGNAKLKENNNKLIGIDGVLQLGHRPGTKDGMAPYVNFKEKLYYLNLTKKQTEIFLDKTVYVKANFELKPFPGVIYISKREMENSFRVPQGIIYTDKSEYEKYKNYYYSESVTIKLKSQKKD